MLKFQNVGAMLQWRKKEIKIDLCTLLSIARRALTLKVAKGV